MSRGHRLKERSQHKVKGPWMPSYADQTCIPGRKQWAWNPGVQGLRQVKKNLRNKCRHILDSKDLDILKAGNRILHGVADEPDPEYSALHLFCVAVDMQDQTGEPWNVAATYLMDKFDAMAAERTPDAAPKTPNRPHEQERGFFRSFLARFVRARDEATPEGHEHQRAGDESGEPSTSERSDPDKSNSASAEAVDAAAGESVHAGR